MSKAAHSVLADALRLEPEARAELAAELLASLDGPADPDAEAAWDAEIERRVAAIKGSSGNTCVIPGVEAPGRPPQRGCHAGDPGWQGATNAPTGRLYVRSNAARRDASASRVAQVFPDES